MRVHRNAKTRAPQLGIPGLPKPRKPKTRPHLFAVKDALAYVDAKLSVPPTRATVRRDPPEGELVWRCVLPLSLCKTTNLTRHGSPRKLGILKRNCLVLMMSQLPSAPTSSLPGRPQVRCVRFSSRRPDRYSDWAKVPVDCLVKLGLIRDDDEESIDLFQWSEPGEAGNGCVLIEVRTGADST